MAEVINETDPSTDDADDSSQFSLRNSRVSLVEIEIAATRFTPLWEAPSEEDPNAPIDCDVDTTDAAPTSKPATEASTDAPANTGAPAKAQSSAATTEKDNIDTEQPAVDIIAAIPKRTEIVIADEPSIVIPAAEAFDPFAAPAATAPPANDAAAAQRMWRNRMIVVGIVFIATFVCILSAVKLIGSNRDAHSTTRTRSTETSSSRQGKEPAVSVDSLPALSADPEPPARAVEPEVVSPPVDPVDTTPPPTATAQAKAAPTTTSVAAPRTTSTTPAPKTTTAAAPTKTTTAAPTKTTTAAAATKTTAAAPPATTTQSKPPAPAQPAKTKDAPIVRETPF